MTRAIEAAAAPTSGTTDDMTTVRSHPLINAITNPPKKVATSCRNLPTFSPIASCMRTVSPDILPITSPVLVSLSKKAISCLSIAFKYKPLILAACLSPVIIQQVTSEKRILCFQLSVFFFFFSCKHIISY
ncbi:hypothetical protein V8G54_020920 [Vigna mungo]|uniref:Uncharacterized protein n=1 Tax=Vigna mungo TaxID=3915 RepID=A0AAQ3NCP3_VIGMU